MSPHLQSEADGGVIEHRPADAAFLFYFHNGVTPSVESLVSRGHTWGGPYWTHSGQNFSRPQTCSGNTAIFMLPEQQMVQVTAQKVCSPS